MSTTSRFLWQDSRFPARWRARGHAQFDPSDLTPRVAGRSRRVGWAVIGGLTGLFLLWLAYRWLATPAWVTRLPSLLADSLNVLEAAGAFTLAFLWAGLWWRGRRPAPPEATPAPTLDELYEMSPAAFERYVGRLFRAKGYRVRHRGRSGDAGVDLELRSPTDKRAIVQCKRYQKSIGPDIVRELFGTLVHERATHAFLVTTAAISDSAREWALGKPMTLIDGETLVEIAASLVAKETASRAAPESL